jgi:hypothetical protein
MSGVPVTATSRAVLAALGLGLIALAASAEGLDCPASFPSQALKFAPTEDGWTTGKGDPAPLYSAEVFDGPPEQLASLIPDASTKGSSTWRFEGSYPQGIWVQCTYAGGALTLTRKLATTPGVCVARYPKLVKGRPVSVSFNCH